MIDSQFGVYLGPLKLDNLSIYQSWRNDPDIYRWCRQTSVINDAQQVEWYDRVSGDPAIKMFEIILIGSVLDPVGVCGLTSIDHVNQRAEFSLYIGPEYAGSGYGESALKTLLSHGFNDLNLNLIWGESFDGNPAIKMFAKVGFVQEGTRRKFYFKQGNFIDAHLFSITKNEFTEGL